MSRVNCSSALLLRELRPVSLLLSSSGSNLSLFSGNLRLVDWLLEVTGCLLGGKGGLREEDEEDFESGSGETKEWRSEEIPEEVEPVELDLKADMLKLNCCL